MDLSPIRIAPPKNATWLSAATLDLHQRHSNQVDVCAADLEKLTQARTAYEKTDFSVCDVGELASRRAGMMTSTLRWYQSALAAIRGRKGVVAAIDADAQRQRVVVEQQLQERRKAVAAALAAVGLDPKTAPADPEAERLVGIVHSLRSTGPGLLPDVGRGIQKIERICVEALTQAMLQGLPEKPGDDQE